MRPALPLCCCLVINRLSGHPQQASVISVSMCADDEWERLEPFGLPLNGLGSDENEGSLERRVRKMCGEP